MHHFPSDSRGGGLKICANQWIEESNGAKKESQRAKTRVGRIHDSKEKKLRFANTRARKNENAAHTWTGAQFQGTGKPILPAMAESMRGPLKIVPSLKRQHHFTRTMPILKREHHFQHPPAPSFLPYLSSGRARGPAAGDVCAYQPPPSPVSFLAVFQRHRIHLLSLPTRSPRRPEGAADFPCLRQLPPPPKKQ